MKHKSHIARKRFGQNFLCDDQVIQKIIQVIHPKIEDRLVEIGPGLAAITEPLLQSDHVSHLDIIELDRDLVAKLTGELSRFINNQKLTIHQADVLKFDFNNLTTSLHPLRIFGNLPYNISTALIFHLVEQASIIQDMHFMFQKEVVDRLVAKPNSKDYGKLSIMTQYFCEASALFNIEPESFRPAPKVRSTFVRLIPHKILPLQATNFSILKVITRVAFNQRRKTIANSLKSYLTTKDFEKLSLFPMLRAEELTLQDYVNIANFIVKNK